MFAHLLNFLDIEEQSVVVVNDQIQPLLDLYIHFERLCPRVVCGSCVACENAIRVHSNAFGP